MNFQDNCPICKSDEITIVKQDKVIGYGHHPHLRRTENFFSDVVHDNPALIKYVSRSYFLDVRQCTNCTHLFQYKVFNESEELDFHQSYFKTTGITDGFKTNLYDEDKINKLELDFLTTNFNVTNILDVGASTGEFCDTAKEYNIKPTALERCLASINLLRENDIDSFESISEINGSFDFIRVSHVLSHMHNNVESFIGDLITKLNDGGIIYFIDHFNNNGKTIKSVLSPLMHVNLFSDKSFDLLMSKFPQLKLADINKEIYYNREHFFKLYRRI